LKALAHGFARFGTGTGLGAERAAAARRIFAAAVAEPWMIAGTGRFCTEAMQALGETALVKTGAEGVFCGTIPSLGLGIALKCDDGATRGAEAMMAEVLTRLLPDYAEALEARRIAPINNRRCTKVGEVRPVLEAYEGLSV
jgi:L-asparaginase II